MAKKYAGLDALRTFLDNLKNTFAALNHAHKISDLTDYTVDSELSTTSTNPLQNKVVTEKINSANSTIASINSALDKKVNLTNGTIQGAVDWNTITKSGCYKIQNCTMTADYNAPLNEYVYGVLQVLNSENETGEYRVTQIYIPRSPQRYSLWIRTNNSTTGYNNWTDWIPFYNANQIYTKFTDVNNKLKNHTSFHARTYPTNALFLKLGTFTGDGLGGRAILTINGRKLWNTYDDGGLKVLTLSSSSSRINGTFYDFGTSNNNTNSTHYKTDDMEILIVCQKDYAKTKADIFIKFTTSCEYNSYFATVDYSDGCSWETDVKAITATDTDPTTDAQSYHTAPIKYIGDVYELRTPKEKAGSTSHTAPYCQSELAIDDFTKLNDYRTIIGTISGTNDWNNIISVRHRNGAGDGAGYGMYLRSKLTSKSNLIWRQQTSSGWESEKTLLDNSNYASYIPQATTSKDGLLSASDKSKLDTDLKNHTSFHFTSSTDTDNVEYIKLGKFTGNAGGGRAIITINGKQGWNGKNDGGLKILTLSSNHCADSTSTHTYTGGTFYTFGHSDDNASSVIEGIATDIVLVRTSGYSTKEVDVYIKISPTKYISYFVTVDYSVGCSWTTSTQGITSSETSPTEGATSYFTVPKKHIADSNNLKELKTPKGSVTSNSYTAPYCQSGIVADSLTELNKYRTTIGTATVSGEWNNIISVRHRNGGIEGDGQYYGMYLRAPMTYESNLMWRQQFGASWKAEKTLLDSSNFTNYIPYETGTCTLTAYSDTVFGGTVSNEILLNWVRDTSKYYTTGSTNSDGTLTAQGTGNARIINAYSINATGTVGVEFAVSGTGAIKIEIKGGGKIYTSGNISLSTTTQKIQITHATSGITVLNDMEINIYASGETSLKIENLLKMTEASTRTLTGNYELIGNQVTVSVFVDNLQNSGEIALYPLPFVPKIEKSGVCGAFSSSSYSSAIYYDIDGSTTAMVYLNDEPQAFKRLTFYYTV